MTQLETQYRNFNLGLKKKRDEKIFFYSESRNPSDYIKGQCKNSITWKCYCIPVCRVSILKKKFMFF